MRFGKLKLDACRYGWMLYGGQYIGTCFDLYGQYSEAEVEIMRAFLAAGHVAIDVGANIGDLTLPMSRFVGDTGRVYAIESHPENFNVLCANLALNGIRNVKPVNAFVVATTDETRQAGTWGEASYVGDVWESTNITLDKIDLPRCDFIKIDVDGPELDVLKGAAMHIERFRPVLYFENDHQGKSAALLGFVMNDLGYSAYWHPAPIFSTPNFYNNAVNHWAPDNVVSLMVLAIPSERAQRVDQLQQIASKDDWWPELKQ
jgi:FkbM family methyltransferase